MPLYIKTNLLLQELSQVVLTCFLRNSGMAKNHGILGEYSGLNLQSLMWVLMVDDKVVSHIHYIMVTVVFTKWTMPSCYVHVLMLKHTLRIFESCARIPLCMVCSNLSLDSRLSSFS